MIPELEADTSSHNYENHVTNMSHCERLIDLLKFYGYNLPGQFLFWSPWGLLVEITPSHHRRATSAIISHQDVVTDTNIQAFQYL